MSKGTFDAVSRLYLWRSNLYGVSHYGYNINIWEPVLPLKYEELYSYFKFKFILAAENIGFLWILETFRRLDVDGNNALIDEQKSISYYVRCGVIVCLYGYS